MTPRQAYVAKRLGALVLIGLALFGWIHGIYWAGGLRPAWTGSNLNHVQMPNLAVLIDFGPILIPTALMGAFMLISMMVVSGFMVVQEGLDRYRRIPTKNAALAAKQAEREANIARLERELGLADPADDPEFITLSSGLRVRSGVGERSGK